MIQTGQRLSRLHAIASYLDAQQVIEPKDQRELGELAGELGRFFPNGWAGRLASTRRADGAPIGIGVGRELFMRALQETRVEQWIDQHAARLAKAGPGAEITIALAGGMRFRGTQLQLA